MVVATRAVPESGFAARPLGPGPGSVAAERGLSFPGWLNFVGALVLLGFLAKLPEAVLPMGSDSGMFAAYGRLLLEGGRPYVTFWDVHPPAVYYYWALIEQIAGTDWTRTCLGQPGLLVPQPCIGLVAHGSDLALSVVAALLVYAVTRVAGAGTASGVIAGLCTVLFANESMISMEGSNPTKLTLVPSLLAILAWLLAARPGWGGRVWAWVAGVAAILAVMAKQPAALIAIVLGVAALWGVIRRVPGSRARFGCLLLGLLSASLIAAILLALEGSLGGFFQQVWVYNVQRFTSGYWQSAAGLQDPSLRLDRVIRQATAALFVAAVVGALTLLTTPGPRGKPLILGWTAASLVAIAGFREFEQVVPSFAILAGIGLGRMWQAARSGGLGLGLPAVGRAALVLAFGTVLAFSSGFQITQTERAWIERGPAGTAAHPELIGAYIRQQVPPGPIFVWGNSGQIYPYAGRDPASRFLNAEALRTAAPSSPESRAQLLSDLAAHPPAIVVLAPHLDAPDLSLDGFPELNSYLAACYQKVSPLPEIEASWSLLQRRDDLGATCGI